jgi:hypothetical protein
VILPQRLRAESAIHEQRAQIPAIFAREESPRTHVRVTDWIASRERGRNDLSNLILYMRRVASSITSEAGSSYLRQALAAAAILQEREDDRDIIVSLAFLHYGATRAGINPEPFFREVARLARPVTERRAPAKASRSAAGSV